MGFERIAKFIGKRHVSFDNSSSDIGIEWQWLFFFFFRYIQDFFFEGRGITLLTACEAPPPRTLHSLRELMRHDRTGRCSLTR